jgi:hypothetical protein
MSDILLVPQSPGDVLDRLVILELKRKRLPPEKAALATYEREVLWQYWAKSPFVMANVVTEVAELAGVNAYLWDLEEKVREANGPQFAALARQIHLANDRRATIKRRINESLGSKIVEVKSYA